jgi:adenylate kinase
VNDDIVFSILAEKLKEPASSQGVILDGFPRTLNQLDKFEKLYRTTVCVNVTLR